MGDHAEDDAASVASSSTSSSISSLNSQLLSSGWTKRPLNLDALSERNCNDVISVLFELLGSSSTNIDNLDALSSRHRTLQYEFERTQKALTATRQAQRRVELEVSGWKSRVVDLEKRLVREENRAKDLRDEVARGRKALDAVRIAAGHENKKVQIKLDAAHAKLTRLANEPNVAGKTAGLVVLNPIPPNRSLPLATGQAPLLEQSLRDLAETRANLEEELEAFRHVAISTANALNEALTSVSGQEESKRLQHYDFFAVPSESTSPRTVQQLAASSAHAEIAHDRLQGLIGSVRGRLQEKVIRIPVGDGAAPLDPAELEVLARAERERENAMQDLLDKVKDLETEVGCARGREEEAKKSLDEYVRRHMQDSMDKAAERDQDANQFLDIMREREKLEDERRRIVEGMSRMNKERRLFERDRQAFLEEKKRADVDDVLARLPNTPSASQQHLDQGTSVVSIHADVIVPIHPNPPTSPWAAHRPSSPSPLSPHKVRTPKTHLAKNKRAKTPLSRLVLEKAVRRKSLLAAAVTVSPAGEQDSNDRAVLGEGSQRANSTATSSSSGGAKALGKAQLGVSVRGKEKVSVGQSGSKPVGLSKSGVSASARDKAASTLQKSATSGSGTGGASGLGASQRRTQVDLGRSSGIGPKSTKGKGVWR